jgi:hypothetical protein
MKKRYILLFFIILFGIIAFILATTTPTQAPMLIEPNNNNQGGSTLSPEPTPVASNEKIKVTAPTAGSRITSPLTLSGASAGWYFEGSFPVDLTDDKGKIIAQGYVTAQGDWMTSEFVPFLGTLEFSVPTGVTHGYLIFRKDNPSGEARFDEEYSLPVTF